MALDRMLDAGRYRIHVAYPIAAACGTTQREMPFVLGVLGDFAGDSCDPRSSLFDRKFAEINRDNFDEVMAQVVPALDLKVPDARGDGGRETVIRLEFRSIADFEPERLAEQVSASRGLLGTRAVQSGPDAGAGRSGQDRPRVKLVRRVSEQLSALTSQPSYRQLEGSWRGLHFLVQAVEARSDLKLRVMPLSKRELVRDMRKADGFERTLLFKRIWADVFGAAEAEPFNAIIGDYEWSNDDKDIQALGQVSSVAEAAACPFITAPAPTLLGLSDWHQLAAANPADLKAALGGADRVRWRTFRGSEASRYVVLAAPRVLARLPYDAALAPASGEGTHTAVEPPQHYDYCWSSAAYVVAARLACWFAGYGWAAPCGDPSDDASQAGLPVHVPGRQDGPVPAAPEVGPTEIPIEPPHAAVLTHCGITTLVRGAIHGCSCTGASVLPDAVTAMRPPRYESEAATADAAAMVRLSWVMATSRFAHALMLLASDGLRRSEEPHRLEVRLQAWLNSYVNRGSALRDMSARAKALARRPLRDASVRLRPDAAFPHSLLAVWELHVYIIPSLPGVGTTTNYRIIVPIPS